MNICDKCGYKVISNKKFEEHKRTHIIDVEPEKSVEPIVEVVEPIVEVPVAPIVQEIPTPPVSEEKVEEVKPTNWRDEIVLKFTKSIEVYINGKAYLGKEIKITEKDGGMSTASEIVRIAREAYGSNILA